MSAGCCLTCTCFSNFVIQSCSSFRLSSLRATYLNDAGFNLKQCGDIYIVHRISHAKHLCTDPIRFPKLFIHFSPSKSGGRKKKRKSGTDGIKMIETTYNGSHNFLSLLLIALPLICWLLFFSFFFLPPPLPSTGFSHRCLFNAIPAHNLCQRGSGSLEAPWSEHKVSQEEKERREAGKGGRTGRRRKVEESAGVSGAILSPSQINCIAKKKKKMIRKKNAKNCKTWNRSPRAQTWNPNRSRTSPLFPNSFPHTLLLSFLLSLHLISSLPLQHSPSSPFSSSVPARSARCQSRKWDS